MPSFVSSCIACKTQAEDACSLLSSQGSTEEGEHAVPGDIGKGEELKRVVAAMQGERAWCSTVAAKRIEHLARQFGEHGGVVFAVDHEAVAASAHAALDVRHGADGCPVIAELVDGDLVAKAFPDVVGGHTSADNVGVIGRNVEEAAGANSRVMDQSYVADGRADARAKDADLGVTLLLEPAEAAPGVQDGLAVGLKREANVRAANLVGALKAAGHAAIVIRQAHF